MMKKTETVYSSKLVVGEHSYKFDAQFLSRGVYSFRLLGESINVTKAMILNK